MSPQEWYVGLISGTSMDAVDAVAVDLSGTTAQLLASRSHPIADELREALLRLIGNRSPHPLQCLGELDRLLGELFADATLTLLSSAGLTSAQIRAIGSHGQTVYHQPGGTAPFTLQIGDPNVIAERTGITTIADFRRRDMAAGGQGAPLAPAFHAARLRQDNEARAVLNLGGIANVTYLPTDGTAIGFDTGPANVLLDGWARRHLGRPYDAGGEWGAGGRVIPWLLARLLDEPYFSLSPPKSTGRELFDLAWLEARLGDPAPPQDVQATLAELTAVSVATAIREHAPATRRLLVCGGGVHNRQVMNRLGALLPGVPVESTARYGVDPDWMEAIAFAWLAQRTLAGRPGNLPAVTGAGRPVVLGGIYPAG